MSDTTYSHGEFCWTELGTRDMPACKNFYAAVAGWDTRQDPMPWDGDEDGDEDGDPPMYTTFQTEEGAMAGGYAMAGEHFEGIPAHWMSYLYAEDVDATVERVKELGGKVMQEPIDVPGVCRMALVQDPHGAAFGLFHPAGHPGAAKVGPKPGGFSWFEVMTPDAEAAKGFYSELFGWDSDTQDMGGTAYTSFSRGETAMAGMMQMDGPEWEGIPPHWMPYLTVEDLEASVAAAKEHGGDVRVPPTSIPGVGRFAILSDPGGAVLATIAYDESITGEA